ncbi:hypothetical protein FRC17_008327, partial [Serendipita sp. 399]
MSRPVPARSHSQEFPPGYGDFQLISSDLVVFHYNRWLLAYVSPVFRDMFAVAGSEASGTQELKLTEDAATLTLLLQFIDPKKPSPKANFDNITQMLEAGRKYQLENTAEWARNWIAENPSARKDEMNSFSVSRAAQLLDVGTIYDIPDLSRHALRVLIKAPIMELAASTAPRSSLYAHLTKLRSERIILLGKEYTDHVFESVPETHKRPTKPYYTEYQVSAFIGIALRFAAEPTAHNLGISYGTSRMTRLQEVEAELPLLP